MTACLRLRLHLGEMTAGGHLHKSGIKKTTREQMTGPVRPCICLHLSLGRGAGERPTLNLALTP